MKKLSFLLSALLLSSIIWMGCDSEPVVRPSILMNENSILEGNDGNSKISLTLRLSEETTVDVSVNYETSDRGAIAGSDFTATSGTLTVPAGEIQTTLDIEIIGDDEPEDDEIFEVRLSNAEGGDLIATVIEVTILNDDTAPISDEGYRTPDNYPGQTLVWQDEFDGNALNTNDWNYEVGTGNSGWGNNELQSYQSGTSNAKVGGGYLTITAKGSGNSYTSARITTEGNQSFQYGRIDIRAKLPRGQGLWPALWMLGDNISTVGWPDCGEIDIMELVGDEPDVVHGTVHWQSPNGNPPLGHAQFGGETQLSSGEFGDEFNVFSIIWDSQSIKWFVNDQQYHVISITDPDLSEFQEKFFFIFNVAVGGNWPGSPDATTVFPQEMIVDYVRVFQ